MTSSLTGPIRSSKAHPQSQTCTRKRSWSLSPGLLLIWSTIAFWLLVKPLHLRSMLSILMRCTPQHPYLALVHRKGPVLHDNAWLSITQPTLQKLNELGYEVFLICNIYLTSHQPNTTSSSFLTTFCRENISTTSRRQKMLSKSSSNPKAQIFMLQE